MKLALSNIAWPGSSVDAFLEYCAANALPAVELAINKIWQEPINATEKQINQLRKTILNKDLEMIGFHAVLYTRKDLKLFPEPRDFKDVCNYIYDLAKICKKLGGKNIVFGSPENRLIRNLTDQEAWYIAVGGFRSLANRLADIDITLLIEALRPVDTNFIVSLNDAVRLATDVSHPNFRIVIDAGATCDTNININKLREIPIDLIDHVHVNDPGLAPPSRKNIFHRQLSEVLKDLNYSKYISIEMLSKYNSTWELDEAISYVKEIYLS